MVRARARRLVRRRAAHARRWWTGARLDFRDWRQGNRDPLIAPRRKGLPSQGGVVGERLAREMQELGGLTPRSAVLDVGCGSGRVAAWLTRVLDPAAGSYEGFDIMPASVKWCRKAITSRHPNFRFQVADLRNAQYNPSGTQSAAEYRFPFDDDRFDVALAASLFTHLRPFEGEHYLEEIGRVLRPGGHLVGTWFLINDEAEDLIDRGLGQRRGGPLAEGRPPVRLTYSFTDERGNEFRSPIEKTPEHLIAIDEQLVLAQHERAGMEVVAVVYGNWPGRGERAGRTGQDMIVARRRG